MTPDQILERLVVIARDLEAHGVAVWRLERERDQPRSHFAASEWPGPKVDT
jgi:hypothetical protein